MCSSDLGLQRSWAHAQVRRAYPEFVSELDMLTPDDVIWEPYSPEAVARRAPAGLSSHCSANASLWLTSVVLVYDIAVEAYCPWRVRRQFGQRVGACQSPGLQVIMNELGSYIRVESNDSSWSTL